MNFAILSSFICVTCVVMTGCATIVKSSSQKISVTSVPTNAKVTVDRKFDNITPFEIELNRNSDHVLLFQKENFQDASFDIKHVRAVTNTESFLMGGLIGLAVDNSSGAQNILVPKTVHVDLIPIEKTNVANKPLVPGYLQSPPNCSDEIEKEKETTVAVYTAMGQHWAVVVGLSEYSYGDQNGLSNLIYADDDAKAFTNSLKQQGWSGSHIKLLTNEQATQRNITIALESWLTKAGPSDMVVLFWSGHGFPDPEDPEKVYFACYDTDTRIPATGYRMDKVRSAVEELGCRNVVMLADTCHAGKLITRGDDKAIGIAPYVDSLVKKQNVPKGWIFMVASDVDRKAIEDSSWSHGAFTHCLLKALNGEADGYQSAGAIDGTVTMGELRAYMNTAMPDETQKVLGVAKRPMITTSTGDPDIWNLSIGAK